MRYVWHQGAWWEIPENPPLFPERNFPAIISDHMEPLINHANGQIYDSKSAFRAATRAAGCVELGNDAPTTTQRPDVDRKQLREDIKQAISELEQGRKAPLSQTVGGNTRIYHE